MKCIMIDKPELDMILSYIIEYWNNLRDDSENEAIKIPPSKFWMKSLGGPVGNKEKQKGRWITTLMYTEDDGLAQAFKEVLMRWQAKGQQQGLDLPTKSPDLIKINRG